MSKHLSRLILLRITESKIVHKISKCYFIDLFTNYFYNYIADSSEGFRLEQTHELEQAAKKLKQELKSLNQPAAEMRKSSSGLPVAGGSTKHGSSSKSNRDGGSTSDKLIMTQYDSVDKEARSSSKSKNKSDKAEFRPDDSGFVLIIVF